MPSLMARYTFFESRKVLATAAATTGCTRPLPWGTTATRRRRRSCSLGSFSTSCTVVQSRIVALLVRSLSGSKPVLSKQATRSSRKRAYVRKRPESSHPCSEKADLGGGKGERELEETVGGDTRVLRMCQRDSQETLGSMER